MEGTMFASKNRSINFARNNKDVAAAAVVMVCVLACTQAIFHAVKEKTALWQNHRPQCNVI